MFKVRRTECLMSFELKFCLCFQGKREENTTVDADKAKEDAKVQCDSVKPI